VLLGFNWTTIPTPVLQGSVADDVFASHCCSADVSFFLNLNRMSIATATRDWAQSPTQAVLLDTSAVAGPDE
jgi:hypothetical protein